MYHLLAILTIIVWGTTFVSTKVLLANGLTPAGIFVLRFTFAYAGLALAQIVRQHRQHQNDASSAWRCQSVKDELLAILAGVAGGSFYFLSENTALKYTLAGNVSLIVCLSPLMTALLALAFKRGEKAGPNLWTGSLISFVGVALIIYGSMEGGSARNPIVGNLLALSGAFSWSVYQLIVSPLTNRYGTLMMTRKVFGYGLLTILPFFLFTPPIPLEVLARPAVWGNLVFLGVVASLLCYVSWNKVIEKLGSVVSANYIYLDPFATCLASYIFLDEALTASTLTGGAGILVGLYLVASKKRRTLPLPRLKK